MPKTYNPKKYTDVKPWVIAAIADEDDRIPKPMWSGEKSAEACVAERPQRITFLLKHDDARFAAIADRLKTCKKGFRCLSGACPECGRLLQRWFVRASKAFIDNNLAISGKPLVSVTIAPSSNLVPPGRLRKFSIADAQRRLKWALDRVALGPALGGVDFSFNEDRDGTFTPAWSVHSYIISATYDSKRLQKDLRDWFKKTNTPVGKVVVRPIKVSSFTNIPYRRSYALKMNFKRRIGYKEVKIQNGKKRTCRNTSTDGLRAKERLELFKYLDRIGLAARIILHGTRPFVDGNERVTLKPWGNVHRING